LKLWLLDADVIIDLLAMDTFDKLSNLHDIYAASSVIEEIEHYWKEGIMIPVDFKNKYVQKGLVKKLSASTDEIRDEVLSKLPRLRQEALHAGELESLAILIRDDDLIFCTRDAAAIRAMPFLDLSERGISVESLLGKSGLQRSDLKAYHTDEYHESNLTIGKQDWVLNWKQKSP